MNTRIYVLLAIALAALCASTACSKKVDLAFKPKPGDVRTFATHFEELETGGARGVQLSDKSRGDMDLTFEVLAVAPTGEADVRITYGESRLEKDMEVAGRSFSMDSEEADSPFGLVFKSIEGKSFTVRVNPKGEVLAIEGAYALARNVRTTLENAIKEQIRTQDIPADQAEEALSQTGLFDELFSEDSLKTLVQDLFIAAPPAPVEVGETWTRRDVRTSSRPRVDDDTFTLVSVDDNGVATVKIDTKTSPNPDKPTSQFAGISGVLTISGTGTGTAVYDPSGWLIRETYTHDHSGEFKTDVDFRLPQSVTVGITIRGTSSAEVKPGETAARPASGS